MRNLKKVLSVLLVVVIMATAMVPAFAAETYTYSTQAKALYDVGLFKGVSATEYVPDLGSALTREQGIAIVVRLLGKADAAAALTAADADAALAAFGDAKDVEPTLKNSVAYAIKNGLVIGDGKLVNPKGAMLGKDLATIILRNLGYTVDAAGYDVATATLADKGGLTAAEATKFATKELIRDDLVGIAYGSLSAKYSDGKTTVIAKLIADKVVDEAKAIAAGIYTKPVAAAVTATVSGAKKFTLAFNTAVDSTKVTAASVTIKKGASTYAVTDFKLADDKKSAVVTISNQIVAGDYTISVTGLADAAVTSTVTAQNERVDSIKFTTDSAVLKAITTFTDVEVAYKIYNQYGEDITTKSYSNVQFTASKGSLVTADSKITLSVVDPASFVVGEKITVTATYIDTDNAKTVFTSSVVTVSQMAQVTELNITGLYNADNATLDVNSTYGNFYLLVDAKDQYGNTVSYSNLASALVMQSTDPSVLNIATSFVQVNINGSKKTALALANGSVTPVKAGTATVILISKYSGKVAQFDVAVKDSQKIDTLTLQTPDYPVAGEVVKVPFTAIDKDGNEITKLSGLVMGDGSKTLTVSGATGLTAKFEQDPVSGKPVLNLDARSVSAKTTVYLTGTTSTYKFVSFAITLQAPAKLDSVSGFKSSIYTNILVNNTSSDFSYGNVLVKDSYGRDVSKDQLVSKYSLNVANTYRFTLASSDATKVSVTPTVAGETYAAIDAGVSPAVTVTAVAKGSVTATLKLQKYNTTTTKWEDISSTTFALAAVKNADLQSFVPTSVASVYTDPDYYYVGSHKAEIKVEGVLANGQKVVVPKTVAGSTYYDVTATGAIAYDGAKYIYATGTGLGLASDKTATGTYTVTIYGANGTVNVPVNTTVSGATPVATTVSLFATTDKSGLYANYVKESDTVASIDVATATNATAVEAIAKNIVKIVDQYGKTCDNSKLTTANSLVKDVIVSDVRNTDNKIVDSTTTYAKGFSVYVTVITTNGTTFSFTLALK